MLLPLTKIKNSIFQQLADVDQGLKDGLYFDFEVKKVGPQDYIRSFNEENLILINFQGQRYTPIRSREFGHFYRHINRGNLQAMVYFLSKAGNKTSAQDKALMMFDLFYKFIADKIFKSILREDEDFRVELEFKAEMFDVKMNRLLEGTISRSSYLQFTSMLILYELIEKEVT